MKPCPAVVGVTLEDVNTAALIIDLAAFERNLRKMAAELHDTSALLRPHAKTRKSPIIARMQMELGAVGVCWQEVAEAEALVERGIKNQQQKLARLAENEE